MWHIKRLPGLAARIPIRWRLTLISLGLLTLLVSALGVILLFVAQEELLNNQATALRNEARLAASGIKGRPFIVTRPPGPPSGPAPLDFKLHANILAQKLASMSANATILSPQGQVIISGIDPLFSPPAITLTPQQIQQRLDADQDADGYLIARDSQGKRQLVVLMPIVSDHATVGVLQLSTPIASIDNFLTTFRLILGLGILGALSLATALTFPLVGAALRPLVEMERTSRHIAAGELSLRLDVPQANDEIGHLARSFNGMVAQLETAFRQQKRFVADVSHELRTPLTALSGSLEMLLIGADKGDVEASRRLARGMYAEVQRMHRMVEDLLILTRLDERKVALHEDTLDVRRIMERIYDQAQQLARGQEISCEIAPDTPLLRADGDKLQQVLLNVVDNALKFTPSDGRIKLSACGEDEDKVRIEVSDNGKGIVPEALPHVFDRFYRADPARSRAPQRVGGSGLGLAIAQELIQAQHGTIEIDSILGEGTSVAIKLPAIRLIPETSTP
ncbi:HAMP domain-containing protein [Ktedonosporobacter rubrisoli]|uniref:histidine kinase n=1 Tax=Ktedonosporobacter rubrisoli TaxID=2509675 RepID=A0A4P6JSI8_KTERU|nr:ATP-binding protein [Ktedonosporobacter rubrisoli]QBD78182.1 HAMP domain-containing protein [Ktedonosporobacter rubrisoli]